MVTKKINKHIATLNNGTSFILSELLIHKKKQMQINFTITITDNRGIVLLCIETFIEQWALAICK